MRVVGREITTYSVALLAVVLLGLSLRLDGLTAQSLSHDEIFSVVLARTTLPQIVQGTANDVHPPLYYFTLHYWMQLFSGSELAVRVMSVIFGVAAIPMIYLLGRSLFDKQVGVASALILAVSSFNIQHAQNARMYSLMVLLALISMYFFVRLLEGNTVAISSGYVLSTTLLLYTHALALLIVVAQNVFLVLLLTSRKHTARLKTLAALQALVIALFIPWILVETSSASRAIKPWLAPSSIFQTLAVHAGSSLLLVIFAALAVFSLFTVRSTRGSPSWKRPLKAFQSYSLDLRSGSVRSASFLVVWLLTLNVVPFAVSTFSGYQIYLSWYVIAASVALYVLAAAGIRNINTVAKVGALGVIVLLSIASVQAYYATPTNPQSREVMEYISDNAKSGDLVLVYPAEYGVVFHDYYHPGDLTVEPFPSHSIYVNPWVKDPEANVNELRSDVAGHNRVWLIDFPQHNKQLDVVRSLTLKAFNESYETTRAKSFFRYTVYLFEN